LITGFELEVHELQNCIDAIEIIARFALKWSISIYPENMVS
jgi:hypothetical protein